MSFSIAVLRRAKRRAHLLAATVSAFLPTPANRARAFALGALLFAGFNPGTAFAQDANRAPLPPVIIQPDPNVRPPTQASEQKARVTRRRAARPAETAAGPVPVAPATTDGGRQTKDGVDGYVARGTAVGTKSATPILQLPRSVSTVTAEEIADRDAQSVQEALQYTAGVNTSFRQGNLTREYTLIRGFLAFQYLDGLKLHDSSWGMEPYGLERVDVLKGPAAFLYGQGSPGGLWNMTSKRPSDQPFAELLMRVGLHNRVQGAFDVGGPLTADRSLLYRVVAVGKIGNGEIDFSRNERAYLAPSFTWRNDDTSITLLASYQNDPHLTALQPLPYVGTVLPGANGQYISRSLFLGEPNYHDTSIESYRIGYEFKHRFNDIFSFEQNARYERINVDLLEVQSRASTVGNSSVRQMSKQQYELDLYQIDNRTKADFSVGPFRHHAMFGMDYFAIPNFQGTGQNRASQYLLNLYSPVYGQALAASNPITSFRYQQQHQFGVYASDRVEVGGLSVLFGSRLDYAVLDQQTRTLNTTTGVLSNPPWSSQQDHAITSNAGAIYKFDNGIAPYASYAQSFYPQTGADFAGKPFIPTTGQQGEAGIKYLPPGYDLLFSAAVFHIVQNNVLTNDLKNPGFAVQTSSVESKGAEFEFKTTRLYGFNVSAAYTHLDPRLTATNTAGALGKHPAGIAANQASLWTTYRFASGVLDGLTLGGGVRYVGESWGDTLNTITVPSYTLFDLSLRYQLGALTPTLGKWDVALNVKNLADKRYVGVCESAQECYYGPGRAFDATIRARW